MPRISKEDVTKRDNLLKEAFRKNPKLKMEEAQVLLQSAGGPKMRPQHIYDLRKEIKAALKKEAEGTTPAANRKGAKTTPVKKTKTTTPKKTTPKKAGSKKTTSTKRSTSTVKASKPATRTATPAISGSEYGSPAANRVGTATPATQTDLLMLNVRHGDRATLDKALGMLKRAGIDVEAETLKG